MFAYTSIDLIFLMKSALYQREQVYFTDCLFSLSIMFSSCDHFVVNGLRNRTDDIKAHLENKRP